MLSIRPVTISFKQETTSSQKSKRYETAAMCVGTTLAVGGAVLLGGKLSVKSFEKALEKKGVEIKDGIAFLKETGEKYTGEIKRNVGKFGFKNETTKYEDGIITEKVYHNLFGQDLEGEFYKAGIIRLSVSEGKIFTISKYDENGNMVSMGACRGRDRTCKFDGARKIIKDMD